MIAVMRLMRVAPRIVITACCLVRLASLSLCIKVVVDVPTVRGHLLRAALRDLGGNFRHKASSVSVVIKVSSKPISVSVNLGSQICQWIIKDSSRHFMAPAAGIKPRSLANVAFWPRCMYGAVRATLRRLGTRNALADWHPGNSLGPRINQLPRCIGDAAARELLVGEKRWRVALGATGDERPEDIEPAISSSLSAAW
ncbi:MAG: hypothetical protein CM15mP74_16750 [Halieaceae bacterium]|nr:MAG: hypothetical protein CM15mP74_16750 [Halieaceae bacterium]